MKLISFLICAVFSNASAQEEGWNPDTRFPALPPAEAIKTIEVPAGYPIDRLYLGEFCQKCQRRAVCPDPIA